MEEVETRLNRVGTEYTLEVSKKIKDFEAL